ncbi:MAG: lysophospholipid acyltransferase family protein [Chloroflexota bacterium]|nr:lysophospholipid acyltransferase family protein [Chloroflexota bacterium]
MKRELSVQEYVAVQPRIAWRRWLMRGALRLLMPLLFKVEVHGLDNIPPDGAAVLMMNHISLLDPVLCITVVDKRYAIPMTKIENMRTPVLSFFIRWWGSYSVDRDAVDRKALMNSIELMKSGQLILIAPEGTRQRDGLARPKEGFAYIATKADAVIIPAAISGAIGWQKSLQGLKRHHIVVNFGVPFKFKADGRVPRDLYPAMMDEAMYQLSAAVTDETMRGAYSDLSKTTSQHLVFVKS